MAFVARFAPQRELTAEDLCRLRSVLDTRYDVVGAPREDGRVEHDRDFEHLEAKPRRLARSRRKAEDRHRAMRRVETDRFVDADDGDTNGRVRRAPVGRPVGFDRREVKIGALRDRFGVGVADESRWQLDLQILQQGRGRGFVFFRARVFVEGLIQVKHSGQLERVGSSLPVPAAAFVFSGELVAPDPEGCVGRRDFDWLRVRCRRRTATFERHRVRQRSGRRIDLNVDADFEHFERRERFFAVGARDRFASRFGARDHARGRVKAVRELADGLDHLQARGQRVADPDRRGRRRFDGSVTDVRRTQDDLAFVPGLVGSSARGSRPSATMARRRAQEPARRLPLRAVWLQPRAQARSAAKLSEPA